MNKRTNEFTITVSLSDSIEEGPYLAGSENESGSGPIELPERLTALLAAVSNAGGYADQAARLEELNHGFRREMAARLGPMMKAQMQSMPHDSHEDKKTLVKWANAELRRFGLAIKSPKTGNASNFVTDKGNHPEKGRFQLRSEGENGKVETFSTPDLTTLLDAFTLMEAPQREEGLVNWADRAKGATRQAKPHR